MKADVAKVARIAQIALLAGAALAGLTWMEDPGSTERVATEGLSIDHTSPVTTALGPWTPGDVLTRSDAGVHLGAAPVWTIAAEHSSDVPTGPHTWNATLDARKMGPNGRPWWSAHRELAVNASGGRAWTTLDVGATVDHVLSVDRDSNTPGTLSIVVTFTHTTMLDIAGEPTPSTRVATLGLDPRGELVMTAAHHDTHAYTHRADKAPPWIAIGLLVAAGAAEVAARARTTRRHPFDGYARLNVVEVTAIDIPRGAAQCTVDALKAHAERTGAPVLVDLRKGTAAVLEGTALVARFVVDDAARAATAPTGGAAGRGSSTVAMEPVGVGSDPAPARASGAAPHR